jgi:hypothetical protein
VGEGTHGSSISASAPSKLFDLVLLLVYNPLVVNNSFLSYRCLTLDRCRVGITPLNGLNSSINLCDLVASHPG